MAGRVNIDRVSQAVLTALDGLDLSPEESLRVTIEAFEGGDDRYVRQSVDITKLPSPPIGKADELVAKALGKEIPVFKTQEERYLLGIALEPLKEMGGKDTQNDTYSAEEVRQAAYRFMEEFGTLGLQHKVAINGRVRLLENWIAREDSKIDGQTVKAGTWLMGMRVVDDDLWTAVKTGVITGLSIGGFAKRTPLDPPTQN